MTSSRLKDLLTRYFQDRCSLEEKQELTALINQSRHDAELQEAIDSAISAPGDHGDMPGDSSAQILQSIFEAGRAPVIPIRESRGKWRIRLVAAAAIIGIAMLVTYRWIWPETEKQPRSAVEVSPNLPIVPGGDKARLILADGRTILLDSAGNGALAMQGGTQVLKSEAGQLSYVPSTRGNPAGEQLYNTVSTPKGGQYRLVLPDGSRVWLNAASSLRFPTVFSGVNRRVELTGEGYFEVAKNPAMPFMVSLADSAMEVEVLGTVFNIMAYGEEPAIRTTLLEGAVKLGSATGTVQLKPGQQLQMKRSGNETTVINNVDTDAATAWKNGLFDFNRVDIKTIMRQVARWYDVEIKYDGKTGDNEFVGQIRRSADIKEVLRILELGHVHFRVDGRTITVTQ